MAGTVALVVDAEAEEPTWTSAVMADWEAEEVFVERGTREVFVERHTGDALQGIGCLRIG